MRLWSLMALKAPSAFGPAGRLTANQSESVAFRDGRGNPVCQLRARLRIHSASRLYIFPRLQTAELTRLSAFL